LRGITRETVLFLTYPLANPHLLASCVFAPPAMFAIKIRVAGLTVHPNAISHHVGTSAPDAGHISNRAPPPKGKWEPDHVGPEDPPRRIP
jgi:hypothetical protein